MVCFVLKRIKKGNDFSAVWIIKEHNKGIVKKLLIAEYHADKSVCSHQ
jgi:hypothetical protein